MRFLGLVFGLLLALAATGCAVGPHTGREAAAVDRAEPGAVLRSLDLDPGLEDRILALDPDRITERDLRTTLVAAPAPRVISVHGGVYPVYLAMASFGRFLIEMGYPEQRLRHPGDGRLSHSPYEDSERLAGLVAWYYEREGLRPMLVGHSQGGVQAVKVLYDLAGRFKPQIPVWNPLTDRAEHRYTITDPLTGEARPVVGLRLAYVSAVGAGGASLLFPNQWRMAGRVRTIPDTVEEFVGYSIDLDLVAWDLPGLAAASIYRANGAASVRNVRLPAGYSHVVVPVTSHLPKDARMKDWINRYAPDQADGAPVVASDGAADNALWAADVWYSIKRHWCLEAQRLIRAKRAALRGGTIWVTGEKQGREDVRAVEQ
jgi:hypothetical protein